jgi:hypothetical protein
MTDTPSPQEVAGSAAAAEASPAEAGAESIPTPDARARTIDVRLLADPALELASGVRSTAPLSAPNRLSPGSCD